MGSNIEKQVVDRELRDLEMEIAANPGPLLRYVITPVTGTQIRIQSVSARGSFMQVQVRPAK